MERFGGTHLEDIVSVPTLESVRIGVVGLGYVGLPVSVLMSQHFPVTGFDVDSERVAQLLQGIDRTRELSFEELKSSGLQFADKSSQLAVCNFYIVTVPTPIDAAKRPDLTALSQASRTVGSVLSKGDIVVYESTVYPGATEEVCVPLLEETSGLRYNIDFSVGYSPERINPGDENHKLPNIMKIVAGSNMSAADLIDKVYRKIILAGTYRASSIRIAEAAKVIENIQRDANIALINELAMLFKKLGLETREILEAAATKWNFHSYVPGFVGGHCIGVDPYYLTYKAQSVGFHPDMILAGRRTNDNMPSFIAQDVVKAMLSRGMAVAGAKVLIVGFTFKENCPDLRNTKVADLYSCLTEYSLEMNVYDPIADPIQAQKEYGILLQNTLPIGPFDVVILAVSHKEVRTMERSRLFSLLSPNGLLYDVKGVLPVNESHARI